MSTNKKLKLQEKRETYEKESNAILRNIYELISDLGKCLLDYPQLTEALVWITCNVKEGFDLSDTTLPYAVIKDAIVIVNDGTPVRYSSNHRLPFPQTDAIRKFVKKFEDAYFEFHAIRPRNPTNILVDSADELTIFSVKELTKVLARFDKHKHYINETELRFNTFEYDTSIFTVKRYENAMKTIRLVDPYATKEDLEKSFFIFRGNELVRCIYPLKGYVPKRIVIFNELECALVEYVTEYRNSKPFYHMLYDIQQKNKDGMLFENPIPIVANLVYVAK